MDSQQIIGIAASSAGISIGLFLASLRNKRRGIDRKRGVLILAGVAAFSAAVTFVFAISY